MMRKPQTVYAADTGPAFLGTRRQVHLPGDRDQNEGAYFVKEALVPPGGGPSPHIHRNEDDRSI
ncbi:MAG: hypothetical protein ACR2IV_21690 [Bryobacteraceae bacterium]